MMTRAFRFLPGIVLLALMTACFAQPNPNAANPPPGGNGWQQPQLPLALGQADTVVLATITDVQLPPVPQGDANMPTSAPGYGAGRGGVAPATVTLRIDKTLAGKFTAGDTVTIPLAMFPSYAIENGKTVMKGWTPILPVKEQRLLALQRGRDAYTLPQGAQSVQTADRLPAWEAALAALPLKVSAPRVNGIAVFDQPTPVSVTIKNLTDKPQSLAMVMLNGYYLGKKMDSYVQVTPIPAPDGAKADTLPTYQQPLTLAPGEEKTLSFYLVVRKPQAWQLFDADSCLLTPAALRAQLAVFNEAGNLQKGIMMFSSSVAYVYVGFPLPDTE